MADTSSTDKIYRSDLVGSVNTKEADLKKAISDLQAASGVGPGDMLDMQMKMNKFAQYVEMLSSMASAMHGANQSAARNVKG